MSSAALMNTYQRLPISFTHGQGAMLYDNNGQAYLDAISGVAVNTLGHAHPVVTQAIHEQAKRVIHTSNLYAIDKQQQLAEALTRLSDMDNVFFCNSGAEANEAAIKLARLYGHQQGIEKPHIVVMDHAFHGRTIATLTASGNRKIQAGFEPLLSGFIRAPYGDIDALKMIADNNPDVVAILLEPIQGEGGVQVLPDGFLPKLRQLCDQQQWLMMLDEIQTGNGRTGRYFAYQHDNITPDVATLAKGLANGVPIGACLAHGAAAQVFHPGHHGSTFGGNPLACAAALAVTHTIEQEQLCDHAHTQGQRLLSGLRQKLDHAPMVRAIRGKGLMVGIELNQPCANLVNQARKHHLLINVTAGNVVRLLPPLIITKQHIDTMVDTVVTIIQHNRS